MIPHNAPNEHPIDTLWAVMSKDEHGRHGIMAGDFGPEFGITPLITGEPRLLEHFKRMAKRDIAGTGKIAVVVRFDRVGEDEQL